MNECDALLAAIVGNPDDDTPRLVYADWLDEHADSSNSYAARAEFIRAQIRESNETDEREKEIWAGRATELLASHREDWEGGVRGSHGVRLGDQNYVCEEVGFNRGFIEDIVLGLKPSAHPPTPLFPLLRSFDALPVLGVKVSRPEIHSGGSPPTPFDDQQIASLVAFLKSTNIRRLDLSHTGVTDTGLECLKLLTHLKVLELQGTLIGDAGLHVLRELPDLVSLNVGSTSVGDPGIAHLGTLKQLKYLDVSYTAITDSCIESLEQLNSARWLELTGTQITSIGATRISESPNLNATAKIAALESLRRSSLIETPLSSLADSLVRSLETEHSTAQFEAEAARILLQEDAKTQQPIEWFRNEWKGHPGEILYRTPIASLSQERVARLREEVLAVLVGAGMSRERAEVRVVLRPSNEMQQDCLTVVGNRACLALAEAVGRGELAGVMRQETRWRNRAKRNNNTHARSTGEGFISPGE